MAVEVGEAYVSIIPSARGFGQALASQTDGPSASAGESAGASFSASFLGSMGKLATVGVAVGAAVGAAAIGAGVGLFKLGSMFDDAFDKIRVTTGATGDTLAGLEGSFKNVFKSVPTDADSASSAVATLNQKLGLSGQPLEALSKQLINLSHITGTDLNTNMAAAVDVFNSFGISAADQPKKLDELFRASQKTGVGVGDLAETMANAGPNLKQLGLNFEQSAGLVAIFGKAGVDVGAVLPALSKTIVQASKDGKNAGDVFKETFDRIKNAPSDTEAAGAAIDTFGARAGPKLAGLIREGKLGYEELAKAIADGGDTINGAAADTADFSEKWNIFKNQVLVGLEPLATAVFNAVGDAMEKLGPKVGPVIAGLTQGITAFVQAFKDGGHDITSSGFAGFLEGLGQTARTMWDGAVEAVSAFVAAFKAGGDDITSSGFNGVMEGLGNTFRDVYDWLKVKLPEAIAATSAALSGIFAFIDAHPDGFTTLASGAAAFAVALKAIGTASSAVSGLSSLAGLAGAAGPIGIVAAAVVALGVAAVVAYQRIQPFHDLVDKINNMAPGILPTIGVAFLSLGAAAVVAYNYIGPFHDAVDAVGRAIAAVAGAIAGAVGPVLNFGATVGGVFATIGAAIAAGVGAALGALQPLVDFIQAHVIPAFAAAGEFYATAMQRIIDVSQILLAVVAPVFDGLVLAVTTAFQLIANNADAVWGAIYQTISNVVQQIIAVVSLIASVVEPILSGAFEAMAAVTSAVWNQIVNIISTALDIIRGIFQAATAVLQGNWSGFWSAIYGIASSVLSGILGTVSSVLSAIQGIFSGVLGAVQGIVSGAMAGIGNAFSGLGWIPGFVSGIAGGVASAFSSIASAASGVVGAVSGVGSAVSGAFSGIAGAVSSAANAVEGAVGRIQSAINNLPGVGAVSSLLSKIPGLAAGGLVTRPTLAVIGEAGPEAVVPLDMFNQGVQFGLPSSAFAAEMPNGAGSSVGDINVYAQTNANPWQIADELRWVRKTAGV